MFIVYDGPKDVVTVLLSTPVANLRELLGKCSDGASRLSLRTWHESLRLIRASLVQKAARPGELLVDRFVADLIQHEFTIEPTAGFYHKQGHRQHAFLVVS